VNTGLCESGGRVRTREGDDGYGMYDLPEKQIVSSVELDSSCCHLMLLVQRHLVDWNERAM
jgi:hypothetical protein